MQNEQINEIFAIRGILEIEGKMNILLSLVLVGVCNVEKEKFYKK